MLKLNMDAKNFRVFGPDETKSNRLNRAFEATKRNWNAEMVDNDEDLDAEGRIMDGMLSEHMCQGWLEGYLLTGRHGFFNSYEVRRGFLLSAISTPLRSFQRDTYLYFV